MPCYSPLKGYRSRYVNESGKRSIVFSAKEGYLDLPVEVACGQCIGCRLERSRQWAIRCVHEASLHDENCFITLTYDNEHLPPDGSLKVEDFQKFMKRLRKHFNGERIRYYHCGEYGDRTNRPHYHALLFGIDFRDKSLFRISPSGEKLYRSPTLERLWPFGYSTIGNVTFESAAYVARYIMKKVTGEKAEEHYQGRTPEYTTMSRRPGIAAGWYEKYKDDVYPRDEVIMRGKPMRPPKFYDRLYEIDDEVGYELVKARRKAEAKKYADNQTPERLRVREAVKKAQISRLVRPL